MIPCLSLACYDEVLEDKYFTEISMDSIRVNASYSDIIEEVNYVVLHGLPDGEGVLHFQKILKFENGFIGWDDHRHVLYFYDNDGKYIRHIHAIGAGPREYVEIGDVCYSNKDSTIQLLDRAHFLLKYSLEGEGISKTKLPELAANIIVDSIGETVFHSAPKPGDHCVLWKIGQNNTLNCVDLGSHKIYGSAAYTKQRFSQIPLSEKIIFNMPHSDIIYSIHNQELHKEYVVNYGEKSHLNGNHKIDHPVDTYRDENKPGIFSLGRIFSTKSFIVFTQFNNQNSGYWHKPTNVRPIEYILYSSNYGTFSSHNLQDDKGHFFYWRLRGAYDNVLIHYLSQQDVNRIIDEQIDLRTPSGERVLDLLDNNSEVLMLMKLKE